MMKWQTVQDLFQVLKKMAFWEEFIASERER